MVIVTRSPILLTAFVLILATLPGSLGHIDVSESGGVLTVDTGMMVLKIEDNDISFHASGSTHIFNLRYSEIVGYDSGKGFGPPWPVRASLEDAVWNVDYMKSFSEEYGNYTEILLSSNLDGILTDVGQPTGENAGSPTIPGPGGPSPPQRTLEGWCSITITISIYERNRTISDSHGSFVVLGLTEAKIDIEIDVRKDAGVDRIALRQELSSPETDEYLVESPFGSRKIVPEYGKSVTERFAQSGYYVNTMSFRSKGKEGAHYSWNSYATIDGSDVPIETYCAQDNGSLAIYTVYPALAGDRVLHDPVIGVPRIGGPAGEVIDAMYEHGMSLAVGVIAGAGAVSAFAYRRYRKERKRDDILDFDNSEYLRK